MAASLAPFVWGSGGEALSMDENKRRRLLAEALIAKGVDTSPIQHPLQGFARIAQALAGNIALGRIDAEEAAASKKAGENFNEGINSVFGVSPATTAPSATPAPVKTSSLPTFAGAGSDAGRAANWTGNADRVQPELIQALQAGASALPDGYSIRMKSGFRPGDPRFHGEGMAADVSIIDPSGKALADYQDPTHFGIYQNYAHSVRASNPNMPMRWGGYFSGGKGKYGALDLMHFDTAGNVGTAGGNWETGLSPQQAKIWGLQPGIHPAPQGWRGASTVQQNPQDATTPPVQMARLGMSDAPLPPVRPPEFGGSGAFLVGQQQQRNAASSGVPSQAPQMAQATVPAAPAPATAPNPLARVAPLVKALQSPYLSAGQRAVGQAVLARVLSQEQKTPAQIEKENIDLQKARLDLVKSRRDVSGPGYDLDVESKRLANAKAQKDIASESIQEGYDEQGRPVKGYFRNGQFVQIGGAKDTRSTEKQNYDEYVSDQKQRGQPALSFFEWGQQNRKASATNLGGGSDKQIFDHLEESYKGASAASTGLGAIREARTALKGGGVFGAGADARLFLRKIAKEVFGNDDEKIVNTETFRAAVAPQIAAMMKATVGSTQISNADREFAAQAAGGAISLDEKSIDRLLGVMDRAGRIVIDRHRGKVDRVYPEGKSFDRERALFGIDMPEPAPAPAPAPGKPLRYNPNTGDFE